MHTDIEMDRDKLIKYMDISSGNYKPRSIVF